MENYNKGRDRMLVEYEDDNHYNKNKQFKNYFEKISEISIDQIKAKKQCKVEIAGIEVYFPYPPYMNQLTYMEKGNLAALESPTGTGKTLCLICASLGWLRAKRAEMREKSKQMTSEEAEEYALTAPFIYYTSRTHSQLANVIKELRKTCYMPRTATLSSRDQMCVNTAVKVFTGNSLNLKCKQVRIRKECKYFFGTEKLSLNAFENTDIEELYQLGSKSGFCPFYFQRNKKDIADVKFLPYNYIFESKFRKALKLEMKNAIILIDEAHNMESVCEASKSFEFSSKMIDECLNDFKGIKTVIEHAETTLNKESVLRSIDVNKIKYQESILTSIKAYIKSFSVRQGTNWPNYGLKLTPKEFFDIFYEGSKRGDKNQLQLINTDTREDPNSRITPHNIQDHIDLLKKIDAGISDELQKSSIISNYIDILELVSILSQNYFSVIQSNDTNPLNLFINNYKMFLNDVEENNFTKNAGGYQKSNLMNNNAKIRTLFLYCFNPGFGFSDVIKSGAQSIIITSGTLSPMESMETELKCNFKVKLENKHVIDKCQVSFGILSNSFRRKVNFKFDASSRNNTEMIEELGHTISDLCKVTPGGILTFFTSYQFLNNCINIWAEREILSEIEKSKEIFKDVQDSNKNKLVLKNFTETCKSSSENVPSNRKPKKGGILFSVCRGSSSEGIDFSDDMARMVIIVGIPYPNLGDVKVNLKKEFLDEYNMKYFNHLDKSMNIKKLSSSDWYTQSATKAVNQALGRVIRHIDDYGSMILIDTRYKELLYKKVFSAWLRDCVKIYDDNKLLAESKLFFENMKNYISEKRLKRKDMKNNENLDTNTNLNYGTNSNNISRMDSHTNLTKDSNANLFIDKSLNLRPSFNTTNANTNTNLIRTSNNSEDIDSILNRNQNALIKRSKKPTDLNDNLNTNNSMNTIINKSIDKYSYDINKSPVISNYQTLDSFLNINTKSNIKSNFNSNNQTNSNLNLVNSNRDNSINSTRDKDIYTNIKPKSPQTTTDIIEDIKTTIKELNNINKDITVDMNKINKVTNKTININKNQSNNYLLYPSRDLNVNASNNNSNNLNVKSDPFNDKVGMLLQTNNTLDNQTDISNKNMNNSGEQKLDKIQPEEGDIFDEINPDDLMDIINQNISYFDDDEKKNVEISNKVSNLNMKTPRLSTSKKKVFRQYPSETKIEIGVDPKNYISNKGNLIPNLVLPNNVSNSNNNINNPSNNLTQQFSLCTPAKNNSFKEEIKSDIIVKKLLELKERDQLDVLLEKYNLKLCFDSQPVVEDDNITKKKKENKEKDTNKKIECPICFESEDKKFSAAKCGHILCSECWNKCLETKLECPMCKKKVRPNTLVNIFL